LAGIAVSHTPTIGFAYDTHKQNDPAWAPIFESFTPVRAWFQKQRPDALVYVFNDHVTSFFFDHYSVFALGIDKEYAVADEGGGARALPPAPGNPELAQHIGASLVMEEFDMSFFQDKPLDHGFFSPMSVLLERTGNEWPTTIVPLQVGVLQFPIPTAARCYKLGQALRRAIESYPQDIKVAVVATGGLSHQVTVSAPDSTMLYGTGSSSMQSRAIRPAWQPYARGIRPAWRAGGCRNHHVADHARCAIRQCSQGAQLLLPAFGDRDRDPDSGERVRRPCRCNPTRGTSGAWASSWRVRRV